MGPNEEKGALGTNEQNPPVQWRCGEGVGDGSAGPAHIYVVEMDRGCRRLASLPMARLKAEPVALGRRAEGPKGRRTERLGG